MENPFGPQRGTGSHPGRWLFRLGIVAAIGAAYFAGRGSRPPAARASGIGQVLYYVDPMHPGYRSNIPGKAPDCGMDLQPVYAGGGPALAAATNPRSIRLTPDQEQAARFETETVKPAGDTRRVQTAGRVAPDEASTYSVSAGADGWVRRLFSDRTGSQVKRGEPLASFFSTDISPPQQAYIYAIESYERLKRLPSPPADQLALATQQLTRARDTLSSFGMGDAQLEELARTRTEFYEINFTAPASGQILERHVAVGQRFNRGELLYRMANLERVWVLADVHSGDAHSLNPGDRAWVTVEGQPPLLAQPSTVPAQFDDQGRTGKLRLVVNNQSGILVPGMIVNVAFELSARSALTVHADAVIDSGNSKRVFVALGDARYEDREVETGWQDADRVEIRSGLKAGERVVTAGAFLLDSESRMKSPHDQVVDAECGMKVDRQDARRVQWKGTSYFFCSEACQRKFTAKRL